MCRIKGKVDIPLTAMAPSWLEQEFEITLNNVTTTSSFRGTGGGAGWVGSTTTKNKQINSWEQSSQIWIQKLNFIQHV